MQQQPRRWPGFDKCVEAKLRWDVYIRPWPPGWSFWRRIYTSRGSERVKALAAFTTSSQSYFCGDFLFIVNVLFVFFLFLFTGHCVLRMVDAQFNYTYEYQGNAAKLVHTPLTDKCYLTLTQGMHMGLGGNPYGPAGTGKTESVKALGGLFGRQVLVFNCDEVSSYCM